MPQVSYNSNRTWVESFCIKVLQNGPIPKHIAFIMDGNRRYAAKHGLCTTAGHAEGFNTMFKTLEWCHDIGITEVTIYAFSIENFKRSKEEVDFLIDLAKDKFQELLKAREKLDEYGIHLRLMGNITFFPVELQKLLAETVLHTKDNNKLYLNMCGAYTSRDEITNAVKNIAEGVVEGKLETSDVTKELLNRVLYSHEGSHPDLVIRTSGEVRLSDFLLWQSAYSVILFLKVFWPEFSIWQLFMAILYYQYNCMYLKVRKQKIDELATTRLCFTSEETLNCDINYKERLNRQKKFLSNLYAKRLLKLQEMAVGKTVQDEILYC